MNEPKFDFSAFDYLIVGQGLAGSVLAMTLINAGYRVAVLNDDQSPPASLVAAGLYNPVYGKELNLTWMADTLYPFLISFYSKLENQFSAFFDTKVSFFYQTNIYRSFINIKQQNKYYAEESKYSKAGFVDQNGISDNCNSLINSEIGGFLTTQAGWLDVKEFLKIVQSFLISTGSYFSGKYNENMLSGYQSLKKVIFCEGFLARENQIFGWLPWNPAKGEILTIKISSEIKWCQEIINAGIFIVPIGGNLFRVGATYAWHEFSNLPTEKAKLELIQKLNLLLKVPYEVVAHEAGVRPATKLRRPFLGLHPENPRYVIFNGFGSKGVSLTPYFARNLLDFLENNKVLVPEVNIVQFYTLYCSPDNV